MLWNHELDISRSRSICKKLWDRIANWAFETHQAPVGPDGPMGSFCLPDGLRPSGIQFQLSVRLRKNEISIRHFARFSTRNFSCDIGFHLSLLARWSYLPDGPDGEKSPMGPMESKARWRPIARCARWTYLPDEPDGPDGHICPMGPMDIFARCARWPDCPMAVAHQASNAEA